MSFAGEGPGLTILVGMILMICSGIAVVSLVSIFNKKNQLNQKEKEIMRASYDQIILQSQLEIQEQTFNTISSELHDNVAQILSLAKVQINIMKEKQEINPDMLDQVKDNISKAMMDLRDIAHGLSSDRIRMRNICDSLCDELERIDKIGFLRTSFTRQGQEPVIPEEKKLLLFRLIQESIQNCIKHAGATDLSVLVSFGSLSMTARITDNGKGFDRQAIQDLSGGSGGPGSISSNVNINSNSSSNVNSSSNGISGTLTSNTTTSNGTTGNTGTINNNTGNNNTGNNNTGNGNKSNGSIGGSGTNNNTGTIGGIGLITMQRRAWLAGGHIDIESSPQNGTSININIPYE